MAGPASTAVGTSTTRVLYAPQAPRPLRPDAASDLGAYRSWAAAREAVRLAAPGPALPGPELTVLLLVDRPGPDALRRTLRSMAAQTTDRWHLSVSVVGSVAASTEAVLDDELATLPQGRATLRTVPSGAGAAAALAAALEESDRPACAFLDAGDALAPDALALLASALVGADVAYGDEDRLDSAGRPGDPRLKPDWSPTLFLSWRYTGRPVALRVAPLVAAGGIRPVDGDWEHDLLLRITERTTRVAHVAEVLCHREDAPDGEGPGTPGAVLAALGRAGVRAEVERGPVPGAWSVRRRLQDRPLVSAIVPFRDSTTFLRACVDSVSATRGEVPLELVLVDNGSVDLETLTLVERLAARADVSVRSDPQPFNWAAINNAAAASARGDVLVFLNDDVEARRPGWLEALVAQAVRPEVGAAGARLLYPEGTVQHAGVVLGLCGVSGHVLAGLPAGRPGYLGMAVLARDVAAVTGACLATRRDVFERLEGFDESLGLDFNDIDYCLRARRRGLHVVYEPAAELVHHESPSRGTSGNVENAVAFVGRWHEDIVAGDPFLNRNLTRTDFSAALAGPEEGRWA